MDSEPKQSLTRTVVEGTALITANTFFQKVAGVLTALLVTNALSVYAYGILRLVQTGIGTASLAFLPGLNPVVIAEAARARGENDFGRARTLFRAYARFLLVVSALLVAAAIPAAFIVGPRWGREGVQSILLSAGFLLLGAFSFLIPTILQAFLEFRALVRVRFVEQVGTLVAVAAVVALGWRTVPAVLGAYLVAGFVGQLFALPALSRALRIMRTAPHTTFSFRSLIFRQGIWSVLVDHLKTITGNVRLWIITAILGVEAVALFSLADALFAHTVSLFPLGQTLLPVVSGETRDPGRMRRIFIRSIKYHAAVFTVLMLLGWSLFPYILEFLFPKYIPAINLYKILLIGLLFASPAPTLNVFLIAYREQRAIFFMSLARTLVSWVGIIYFTKYFGIIGMAFEDTLTWIFFTYGRLIMLLRSAPHLRFHFRELFVLDDYDRGMLHWLRGRVSTLWIKIVRRPS